jgi:biopolymer transport protein ExbD
MFQETGKIQFASTEPDSGVTIHVAPLIDIVFLLICFYLLVAQMIGNQKDLSVQLPAMANPVIRQEAPAELVINLRQDGMITVGGRRTSLSALRALLVDQVAGANRTKRTLSVVVRADRRQRYGKLDEVFKVCRQSGVRNLVLRAAEKER